MSKPVCAAQEMAKDKGCLRNGQGAYNAAYKLFLDLSAPFAAAAWTDEEKENT